MKNRPIVQNSINMSSLKEISHSVCSHRYSLFSVHEEEHLLEDLANPSPDRLRQTSFTELTSDPFTDTILQIIQAFLLDYPILFGLVC